MLGKITLNLSPEQKAIRHKAQIKAWRENHKEERKIHNQNYYHGKQQEKMNQGKVYKIHKVGDDAPLYIGSTFGLIEKRFGKHLSASKRMAGAFYDDMAKNPKDYAVSLIKEVACTNRTELCKHEENARKTHNPPENVNKCSILVEFQSCKDYQHAYQRRYYELNKEKIKNDRLLKQKAKDTPAKLAS